MPNPTSDEQRRRYAKAMVRSGLAQALSLGMNFAAGMALFTFIGYWLDRRRGGGVSFTLGGMFLGLLYGAYETWKTVRALLAGDEARRKQDSNKLKQDASASSGYEERKHERSDQQG